MATYDRTKGDGGVICSNTVGPQTHRRRVILAKECVAAGIALATGFTANDIIQFLDVPAGTFVHACWVRVLTAEGATLTCEIGDGSDVDGFAVAVNLNAAGYTDGVRSLVEATPNTFTGYSFGKLYTAADTLDIKILNSVANAAVFDVFVQYTMLNTGPAA